MMLNKFTLVILLSMLMLLFVTGCGGNNNAEIVGKWTPDTAIMNGKSIQYSEFNESSNSFEFNFRDDGKCNVMIAGIESDGSYTFNDTSVDVKTDNEEYKLDYSNGTLTLVLNYDNNNTSFTFVKTIEKN